MSVSSDFAGFSNVVLSHPLRAWVEPHVEPDTRMPAWGHVALLTGQLHRLGYTVEEHRIIGRRVELRLG